MEDLSQLTVSEFLARVSQRKPTPGGGSVTGAAGAMACALAEMVAAYSIRKDIEPGPRETVQKSADQLRGCHEILKALMTQDAVAYQKMNAAARAARESSGDLAVAGAYERAVFEASAVPMEMAAVVSNALAAMDAFKHVANAFLLSDLAISAALANVTARAARATLRANAREIADESQRESLLADMDRVLLHCSGRQASIEAFVDRHLEEPD